jgi:hypothetical protein
VNRHTRLGIIAIILGKHPIAVLVLKRHIVVRVITVLSAEQRPHTVPAPLVDGALHITVRIIILLFLTKSTITVVILPVAELFGEGVYGRIAVVTIPFKLGESVAIIVYSERVYGWGASEEEQQGGCLEKLGVGEWEAHWGIVAEGVN